MDSIGRNSTKTTLAAVIHHRQQLLKKRRSLNAFIFPTLSVADGRFFAFGSLFIAAFIGLSTLSSFLPSSHTLFKPVNAIAELEDLLLLAMMQNLASGGGAAGAGGGNALTGAFSGLGRGLGCSRAGARIQVDNAGPGSMPSNNEVGPTHHNGVASEGNARAISVDPNPAPLIKAGEETNSINHHQRTLIANGQNNGTPHTPFLDFEILPGFVINGSSSSSGGGNGGGTSGSGGFQRQQPMSSGQPVDPNAAGTDNSGGGGGGVAPADVAANSGAEIEQVVQVSTSNTDNTANVTVSDSASITVAVNASKTDPPRTKPQSIVAIKISAKPANLVQQPPPGAAANADKNKLTSMFGWDQPQDPAAIARRRRKRSIQPVYEGQAREGRRGEPSFQRGSKRNQTPGVVSNIGPSTAQLKRTTGRLIESRLETLVDRISAMNSASGSGGGGGGGGQQINMPFNSPAGGSAGGGGTLGGYLHPEGFTGGIPAPQYYGPNAGGGGEQAAGRVFAPGFNPRNPFDSPAANQAPWPDSQVAYVQPGQYQTSPQNAQQVLNNFLRFLPRLLEAARKR